MPEKIFGFIGKSGAGKGSSIQVIRELLVPGRCSDVPMFEFSDPINECLQIFRKPKSRPNQQLFSDFNRQAFGQDLFSGVLFGRVTESPFPVVGVGGIRRPLDIQLLESLPGFRLVFVTAPRQVRYERIRARDDRPGDADLSWEEFLKQDSAEAERLIEELGKHAHYEVNNGLDGLDHLRPQISAILKSEGLLGESC